MKVDNEFQKVGKKIPYEVPGDFFEKITKKTLQQAKLREQKHRINRTLWQTMSFAASLAAALLLGYMILYPDIKSESNQLVMQTQSTGHSNAPEPGKGDPEKVPAKRATGLNQTEGLSAVLADLTDDELQQMATMLKTDPFISESVQ